MSTLAEGIESIKLACTLVLLIPALGIILFGRRRAVLVPIWISTVAVIAWLRFVGWFDLAPSGVIHIAAGFVLVGLAIAAWKRDDIATDAATTALAAVIATWTWVPCVGRELGEILNNARSAPWSQLGPTVLFVIGTFLPMILIAALGVAVPQLSERVDRPPVRMVGLGIIFLVGALVCVQLFDDLAGELARRSSY